jgi:ubiquinone/menaquinone biosynthesis C-methylase UbiE
MGDALSSLPTVRWLCEKHQAKADFFTSAYCLPMKRLLEFQSCIRNVVVPPDYQVSDWSMGIQPWEMPIPSGEYEAMYHLGFRAVPDKALPDFIAESVGAPHYLPTVYEYPDIEVWKEPYIVLAPRGETSYSSTFVEVCRDSDLPVVQIGASGDHIDARSIDRTGLDLLETAAWIAGSKGFVGILSSQLVLANGFKIPRVAPHDGVHWDMRHVRIDEHSFYPINPSPTSVLRLLGQVPYCRTLDPDDYNWILEAAHIHNMIEVLCHVPVRLEHQHRKWEYGLALKTLRANKCKTILDVGGGGSMFAPAAAWIDMAVTQIDPGDFSSWSAAQSAHIHKPMKYITARLEDVAVDRTYDGVTCLSVLEHIEEDQPFLKKLMRFVKPGGLLFLTVDFHPDGRQHSAGHLRTYNREGIARLIKLAAKAGFVPYGQTPDYKWMGPQVYDYSFGALALWRRN